MNKASFKVVDRSETHEIPAEAATPVMTRSNLYPWYVVFICTLCYTLAHIDRQILGVLVGPIKAELHVTDTQIGLLAGLAFTLFYSTMGVPLGRLADTHNRRNLIIGGVVAWSAMTALCSVARSFGSLFLARIGVGVGEASLSPAASSMIADYVPPHRLATALGLYHTGISVGGGLALLVGGAVVQAVSARPHVTVPLFGEVASWRLTFLIVGLPGLLLALLLLTVKEPLRLGLLKDAQAHVVHLPLREAIAQMRLRLRSVLGIGCGMAFVAGCNLSNLLWAPSLLQRIYGYQPREIGLTLGINVLVWGCLGVSAGGWLADRWYRRGVTDAHLRMGIIGAVGSVISFACAYSSSTASQTLLFMAPAIVSVALPTGGTMAALQLIFPNQLRATIGAVFLLIITLIGSTLGPLLPGLLNDYVFHSELALGKSMLISTSILGTIAAVSFAFTLSDYRKQHEIARQSTS